MEKEKRPEKSPAQRTPQVKLPRMSRQQWLIVLLLGVLLAVISLPVGGKKKTDGQGSAESQSIFSVIPSTETENLSDEKSVLERKMEQILSGAEGVGETRVLLVTQADEEAGYFSKNTQKVTGVLISAKGAGNSVIIQNIKEAVMALFQIEAHRIKVMKMK